MLSSYSEDVSGQRSFSRSELHHLQLFGSTCSHPLAEDPHTEQLEETKQGQTAAGDIRDTESRFLTTELKRCVSNISHFHMVKLKMYAEDKLNNIWGIVYPEYSDANLLFFISEITNR